MAKTHTKINQLTGETLKGFAYANNTDKELVDDVLATRDPITNYTEIAREYDVQSTDIQFTGTGNNDLSVNSIITPRPYTLTIDSQDNYSGLYFNGIGINDVSVGYLTYSGQRPIYFQFGIIATNDELSTGSGGFTGTPINGELFTTGSGANFKFISYDSGTDTIYAYDVSTSPAPSPSEVFNGSQSGASVTVANVFVIGTNEVGAWSDSNSNNGVWSIQPTVAYTIGLPANTLDVTFNGSGHTLGDIWQTFFVKGSVNINLLSPSGTFTSGETITQASNPGASATVGIDNGGNLSLINIVGQLNLGASSGLITGSLSGQTATLDVVTSYSDTFTWTDGTTTENQVVITSGNQVLDSGNIAIQFSSTTGHNVGDQFNISFPITTITTGYESNQITFPGVPFPIDGSAMVATDGTDKIAVGALDMKQFGQSYLTSGIVALYGDGSQTTFTTQKGFANMNLYDSATNKSMNVNYSGDNFELSGNNGSGSYGLTIDPNSFRYNTNGNNFTLPTSPGAGAGYVVTDVNGNGVLTLEPAAGGTIPGNNYEVVLSDGTGGATTTANFQYNTATLVPTILSNEGIYYDPSTRFAFLGDNNGIYNNNYVRVNDSSNEVVINTNPNGSIHIGDTAGTTLQIVVAPPTNEFKVGRVFSNQNFIYANGNSGLVTIGDTDYIFTGSNMYLDTASGVFTNVVSSMWQVTDTVGTPLIQADTVNNKTIISAAKTSINLQAYSDDTAAGIGGLVTGELYQTDGTGAAPLNVAGIVMIKQ